VEQLKSADHLLAWAQWRLSYLLRETGARLIIIDSIAAVYRPEFDDPMTRANHLVQTVAAVKTALREVHGVAVCVNHVSQRFERSNQSDSLVVPALGPSWSACLSMRIFLDKTISLVTGVATRSLRVLHASHMPRTLCSVPFVIDKTGVRASENTD
jgi:DNA-repair protein XRCC3